jgi:SAM-dependent methyltransferase
VLVETLLNALGETFAKTRSPQLESIVNFAAQRRGAWIAQKAASLPPATKLLDAGAGQCQYRDLFAHCVYKTQDFAKYAGTPSGPLREDWRYGHLDYVCDIEAIPVPDGEFDAVLCTEVLEHVQRPIEVLRELSRIVRPGGRIFLTAPLASGLHQRPHHYYGGYTPHFYETFLPQHGVRLTEIQPIGGLMLHAAQEAYRVGRALSEQVPEKLPLLPRFLLMYWLPYYLSRWEARFDMPEFTVGYMIEGVKQ